MHAETVSRHGQVDTPAAELRKRRCWRSPTTLPDEPSGMPPRPSRTRSIRPTRLCGRTGRRRAHVHWSKKWNRSFWFFLFQTSYWKLSSTSVDGARPEMSAPCHPARGRGSRFPCCMSRVRRRGPLRFLRSDIEWNGVRWMPAVGRGGGSPPPLPRASVSSPCLRRAPEPPASSAARPPLPRW
jgi:hypothetical protein